MHERIANFQYRTVDENESDNLISEGVENIISTENIDI